MIFCDNSFKQVYNDPEVGGKKYPSIIHYVCYLPKGKSMKTLKKLIGELASIFPDQYMHMGSDETAVGSKCTQEGKHT